MIYYVHDGTFEGLLTAIYEAYYRTEKPDYIIAPNELETSLFANKEIIYPCETKAGKVYRAIKEKISPSSLQHVYYAYLSELPGASTAIYCYLKLGFKVGRKLDFHHTHEQVLSVHRLSQKVGKEKHRMLGLVRFQLLAENSNFCNGDRRIYYAPIEPDHNISVLLAPHFAKRLNDQNWIIHDVKRGVAILFNQKDWLVTTEDLKSELTLANEELNWQDLWRTFYENIAIKERTNPKLQRRFMPVRYWKWLTEK